MNYSFTDLNPLRGLNYYRLRQTDFDGQSTVSDIRSVNMNEAVSFELVSAYFASDALVFKFNQEVPINKLNLYDVLGRIVYSEDYTNSVLSFDEISIPYLLSGNYFLDVRVGDKMFSKKLVKL